MALTITEKNGVFIVEGALNASTSKSLLTHCKSLLKVCGKICIDVQQIACIDKNGLLTIRSLYEFAKQSNTIFRVVGDGFNENHNEVSVKQAA